MPPSLVAIFRRRPSGTVDLRLLSSLSLLLLAGCASTPTYTAANAPDYVVTKAYTPFYKLGPLQGAPDAALPAGTRVKLLKDEMGYDQVLLDDQRVGYVASQDINPAPPLPKPSAAEAGYADSSSGSGRKHHGGGDTSRYVGEQPNDTPLPESNVPPPDLNVGPEEVAAPAATPTPPPEKPKFRY